MSLIAVANAEDILTHLSTIKSDAEKSLCNALKAQAFSNRMLVSPRRLNAVANEEVESFFNFIHDNDAQNILQRGNELAQMGLGQAAVLEMCSALRSLIWSIEDISNSTRQSIQQHIEAYTVALLEGYMQGREEEVRLEQERTREAYLRTLM